MQNILLGVTGSVAATLTKKMALALKQVGDVKIIYTQWGEWFVPKEDKQELMSKEVFAFRDRDEWPEFMEHPEGAPCQPRTWQKGDPVLHIDLRREASCLVIAPLTANTLAKMAHGLCDNLLTSLYRAWDHTRPVVVAPAMNTLMWRNEPTNTQVRQLRQAGIVVVPPISKGLACGDEGIGAMALIDDIVAAVKSELRWQFPLGRGARGIPINHHPGAFGFHRHHNWHTGVDLYTYDGANVYAVEAGTVVLRDTFTGPKAGTDWWEDTWAMMIEGATGVVNYGEIEPDYRLRHGDRVSKGQYIGKVKRVLFENKHRPDIPGHSCSMLHVELYKHGAREFADWHEPSKNPNLLDPTPYLMAAVDAPAITYTWDNAEGKTVG